MSEPDSRSESKSKSESLWVSEIGGREGAVAAPLLGATASRVLTEDPVYFSIYASRYKFVSRVLGSTEVVVEIGCGDGFGATFLSRAAQSLTCIDIDEQTLKDCRSRLSSLPNVTFRYHDLVKSSVLDLDGGTDAVVMVDVIEHIFEDEEASFLSNSVKLLRGNGFAIVGTPNVEAERFSSEHSRRTHVNLKSAITLRKTLESYFERVIVLGQNDEVVHTGFFGMCHYLWALCFSPKN